MNPARTIPALASWLLPITAVAGVGDPQIKTDHAWYPGELAMSTFERLAETQAEAWERVTGKPVSSDEDRALASWFWRNVHYAHAEEGRGDYFDEGFEKSDWNREYWHGLFAHGFALCGTTHSQWTAEFQALLGHGRSRAVGVAGHNSFEVFLEGGTYGDGRWALLDHDLSTVVFDADGTRLVSIEELIPALGTLGDPDYRPDRQRGWRIAGLHRDDVGVFTDFRVAEYFAGYAGPPPMVHLRRGETLRRYLRPGLDDGKTFVFWGRNYNTDGIPGPERSRSWVNQPDRMFGSKSEAPYRPGQVRYANAVFTYRPDFSTGRYREGVVDEGPGHVTFEFSSPYVIAATPPDESPWGIYESPCRNGLVIRSDRPVASRVSTDRGTTWQQAGGNDLTDLVKGHQQYWLRLEAGAPELSEVGLEIRTVCQANVATIPRLRDGENIIAFAASGQALVSAGPNRDQALAHAVDGSLDSSSVTLELAAPRGEDITGIHAASHNLSGNPPSPDVRYSIECSTDGGGTWTPVADDWRIVPQGSNPKQFWSQSFTYGATAFEPLGGSVLVRFSNDGGKKYRRVEAHLVYETADPAPSKVTFAWVNGDSSELRTASRTYPAAAPKDTSWRLDAGPDVQTRWVEIAAE
ncbi:MAG: hypothetical protein WD342_01575 [Verrucomicrobiales bacterium]